MSTLSIIITIIVGVVAVGFPTLVFIVALLEKQYLKQDLAPTVSRSPWPGNDYSVAMKEQAGILDFKPCGEYYTREDASIVKGNASFWLSPDHRILCSISDGKYAGMVRRKTELKSLLPNGQVMTTLDEPGIVDITGNTLEEVCYYGDLFELYHIHIHRSEYSQVVHTFNRNDILNQLQNLEMDRGRRMVELGFGRFCDESRGILKYTIKGAYRMVTRSGLGNRPDISKQSHRSNIKRPGDPGFTASAFSQAYVDGGTDEAPSEDTAQA